MSPDVLERMCEAWWNAGNYSRPWAECPEEWKADYRNRMRAAVAAKETP